jgi:hypothetical protein
MLLDEGTEAVLTASISTKTATRSQYSRRRGVTVLLLSCVVAWVIASCHHSSAVSKLGRANLKLLQSQCVQMILTHRPPEPSSFSYGEEPLPDEIRKISDDVTVCNDPVFDADYPHVILVVRWGTIRIGDVGFVPPDWKERRWKKYAPGIWIEKRGR